MAKSFNIKKMPQDSVASMSGRLSKERLEKRYLYQNYQDFNLIKKKRKNFALSNFVIIFYQQ